MRLQTIPAATLMPPRPAAAWPDAVAYREAVQNPIVSLGDPDLQTGQVVLDRRGLPLAYSGRFAVVFRLRGAAGEDWAVRCFTHAASGPGGADELRARYQAMADWAARQTPDYLVPFRYVEQGIRIEGGAWLPILVMRWANGEPLGRFIERRALAGDGAALLRLCDALTDLRAALEADGVSHGDWQHDNLLVSNAGRTVTLVDYDGLFVPDLAGWPAPGERGHPNYQHPHRAASAFGPGRDRFAHLVLDAGLRTLARDPYLFDRLGGGGGGGESVLFTRADFLDPDNSPVFAHARDLAHTTGDVALGESLARLETACRVVPPPAPNAAAAQWSTSSATIGRAAWWLQPEEQVTRVAGPSAGAGMLGYTLPGSSLRTLRNGAPVIVAFWAGALVLQGALGTFAFSRPHLAPPALVVVEEPRVPVSTLGVSPWEQTPPPAQVDAAPRMDPFQPLSSSPGARTVRTASGLEYQEIVVGKGGQPRRGQLVTVRVMAPVVGGAVSDQPWQTRTFFLGSPGEAAGLNEGIATMRVGGRRALIVPAALGYGARGAPDGSIPPNTSFVQGVELVSVR